ncbi:MAG: HAMP domain-containing sensor histidine kinase [Clostridia bacterium]
MKLWQKIFLFSLAFVIIAVSVTAVAVLNMSFSHLVTQEKEKNLSQYEYYETTILNSIAYKRLQSSEMMLTPKEIEDILISNINALSETGLAIYDADKIISERNAEIIKNDIDFQNEVKENTENILIKTDKNASKNYIIVGSSIKIEGNFYYLYTLNYTTDLFEFFSEQTEFIKVFSIVFASVISLILLILTFIILRPLTKINNSIKIIAKGNYKMRLKKKGSPEFVKLSANINKMASSIEKNINRLEDIANSRTQFVDNFAHEMKTPLTSIMCFSDLLRIKRNVSEEERQEYANVILEESRRMKKLSSKLLEITTTNSANIDLQVIETESLIRDICLAIAPIMKIHDINFRIATVKTEILADKELIKSLVFNLLDNAIKASDDGSEIQLICKDLGEFLTISVKDFGIGMSKENLQKVTEAFYMVDKSRSRKSGGAGLGLTLCESIAKAHNAKIKYKSELGVGTAVTLILSKGKDIQNEDN